MKIFEYELEITGQQTIPTGNAFATPLSVAAKNGKLILWAISPEEVSQNRYEIVIDIIGTGYHYSAANRFVGTVIMPYNLVCHVFAEGRKVIEDREV